MGQYVLGISAFYHDSSASLIKGDRIIAAASEERFTRKKHDPGFPIEAVKFCLEREGISLKDVGQVVFYEKPFITFERIFETYLKYAPRGFSSFATSFPIWAKEKIFMKSRILDFLAQIGECSKQELPPLNFSAHHLSHAAGAFYPSPFESSAVVCMDGVGEWATTTIWHGRGKGLKILKQINFPHSIGLLYSAFTYFCGFKVNDGEYKLMGLAPYGNPKYADLIKENLINISDDGSYKLDMSFFDYATGLKMTNRKFSKLFNGPPRVPESDLTQREMDLAASVQVVVEEVILKIVTHAKELTGEKNLCLSGGVALNCVANGKIVKENIFEDIWIQPAASDAGSSLGACLAEYYLNGDVQRVSAGDQMQGCYLGPEYSEDETEKILKSKNADYEKFSEEEIIDAASKYILEDKVVGWFQGRSEFGPRALGSRSILGNANSPELQRIINLKIKYRESFRPFAPAMLEEEAKEFFNYVSKSPYMLLVDEIKDEHLTNLTEEERSLEGLGRLKVARSTLPAITHVDNSARIQTVDGAENPKFKLLLDKVKNSSGKGVIINTSFNVRSEPIVNSPEDAYRCFMKTEMDVLVAGNFLLKKENQPVFENEESLEVVETMTKKQLLVFWLKVYVFILVLSYVTLPFFGFERTLYPALFGIIPMAIAAVFENMMLKITLPFKRGLKVVEKGINTIFLGIIYYFLLTPYSFLMKIFMTSDENKDVKWEEGQELKVNQRLF